jgi:digeranylgeranylglycerophospholipid reductase
MDSHYDVIVVGAGPAGSTAALNAARGGAKTLLLEKHEKVGMPVCCAEGITTSGLEQIVKPRPEWIATTIEGASVESPRGTILTFLHPAAGYVLNRDIFDAGLAQLAVENGVDLATSSPAIDVNIRGKNYIESLFISSGDGRREVTGKVIIAADGIESRFAYMSGIDTTIPLDDIDSACQYYVGNIPFKEGIIQISIGNEIAPGGYVWLFPKSKDTANIGIAVCPARANGRSAKDYLDHFVKERYPNHIQFGTIMGAVPAFNRNLPLQYGNLLLTGDAARLVDSLSGAGIANALLSGSIAGKTAAAFVAGQGQLSDYPKEFFKLKKRELYAYKLFRSIYVRTTDQEFEQIINEIDELIPQKKVRDVNVPDIIFKLIFRNPGLLRMARHLIAK